MLPASMCGSAPIQVLTATSLTKVVNILSEETSAISGNSAARAATFATCAHNIPSIAGVGTSVPEQHPSSTTTLEHLKSHKMPASAKTPIGFAITPAMQAVVVDCVPIVDPQLATIIRDDTEAIIARPENSQTSRPTNGEMIASGKSRPPATCVTIVHKLMGHAM